jgi:hypothetical protein
MQKKDTRAVKAFIEKNPTASFSKFASHIKGVSPISDCYYYTLRRQITGMVRDSRKRSNMYVRLFLTPASEIKSEAKELLQKFIDALNVTHHTRMEMIEFGNPPEIEIRELKVL